MWRGFVRNKTNMSNTDRKTLRSSDWREIFADVKLNLRSEIGHFRNLGLMFTLRSETNTSRNFHSLRHSNNTHAHTTHHPLDHALLSFWHTLSNHLSCSAPFRHTIHIFSPHPIPWKRLPDKETLKKFKKKKHNRENLKTHSQKRNFRELGGRRFHFLQESEHSPREKKRKKNTWSMTNQAL